MHRKWWVSTQIVDNVRFIVRQRFYGTNVEPGKGLISVLEERGLLSDVTSRAINNAVKTPTKLYLGADPTARSLHLGNLVPMMVMLHFYIRGHTVMPLVGGATGMVGDPSGRTTERTQLEEAQRETNVKTIHLQMKEFLKNGSRMAEKYGHTSRGQIEPVNNYDWWKGVTMLDFLHQYGSHIRVTSMLARESVKQRINSEKGLGFNEFTYQLLQAFDFYHLFRFRKCRIQVGGNDQWGNITAGIDLIKRLKKKDEPEPFGLTVPLLTTPSGEKFGKSAGNAIFIDSSLTRPYYMYQYFINMPDSVVEHYLKLFTLKPLTEIRGIVDQHFLEPEKRFGQKVLASEVTDMIHGPETTRHAQLVTRLMFDGEVDLDPTDVINALESQDMVSRSDKSQLLGKRWKELISVLSGKSKSESERLVKNGGVYVGLSRNPLQSQVIEEKHFDGDLLIVRVGKTDYYAVHAT